MSFIRIFFDAQIQVKKVPKTIAADECRWSFESTIQYSDCMLDSLLEYCASQPGLLPVSIEVLSEQGFEVHQKYGLLNDVECQRIDQLIFKHF